MDLRKLSSAKDSNKALAADLDKKAQMLEGEIRSRNKTSSTKILDKKESSIFDFLLTEQYQMDFLEMLKLNQTLANKDDENSKTTLLSQKKFLEMVKSMRKGSEELQGTTQSAFYKWLSRNGLGTREQITKYYKSRSKEIANHLKRRVIIEELISDLGSRPELVKDLFSQPEFRKQIIKLIQKEIKR